MSVDDALPIPADELATHYGPLAATIRERAARRPPPFLVGIAGSVAVGKSTTTCALAHLLAPIAVAPVPTDGFLFPNAVLDAGGILRRKGFPESYDLPRLARFLADLKAGRSAAAPLYSHASYDIVPDAFLHIEHPEIVIVEGVITLQDPAVRALLDLAVFVDADEAHIVRWYTQRFLDLRDAARRDPTSFFTRFLDLTDDQARARARQVWDEINGVNLREHILPSRAFADLVVEKGPDHAVTAVRAAGTAPRTPL